MWFALCMKNDKFNRGIQSSCENVFQEFFPTESDFPDALWLRTSSQGKCPPFFSRCSDEIVTKSNAMEKGFLLAQSFRLRSTTAGRPCWGSPSKQPGTAGPIQLQSRSREQERLLPSALLFTQLRRSGTTHSR